MYLKSLVLKGFKSFADRCALTLEPGITAIVGPNGSGKSNISDAVLWVLGERSARNLRGQAMDDIIFSGSAARKAVSIAEVDLVLDNSDHTLPVEFDEVVITRRMYRSGESEYLVNGVVVRRLDVLDILHDTGLGTGTHSIISQGSLDSILQSRPEDRRALIEEAAGVLKHKQRKEKSARKLEQMDAHLERVRDVLAEVSRQLGPLERKAKRAEAHRKAASELSQVRLALAVDDLRSLQEQWESILAVEKDVSAEVEQRRRTVEAAEQKVNDYQELMKRDSEDAGALARRQRRAASLAEKLDGAEMLLRERRRSAIGAQADARASLAGSAGRREAASRELEAARAQLADIGTRVSAADAMVEELSASRADIGRQRRAVEDSINELSVALRTCENELDAAKRRQAGLQDSMASNLAQARLVEARTSELASDLEKAQEERDAAQAANDAAGETLARAKEDEAAAQRRLIACFEERDAAQSRLDAAREAVHLAEAEIKAIEQAQLARSMSDPALRWLIDHSAQFAGGLSAVSKAFRVSRELESLVENLLGEDLASLAVRDAASAREIADALVAGALPGDVSVVMRAGAMRDGRRRASARACAEGRALVDELQYSDEMAPVVEALLGDVVLCPDRAAAFAAHGRSNEPVRFASPDGCAIWPSGKVRIYGPKEGGGEGVIAQERRLDTLRDDLARAAAEREAADGAAKAADSAYREAQAEGLRLGRQLAKAQGGRSAAEAELRRCEQRLEAVRQDAEQTRRRAEEASRKVEDLEPDMEALATRIAELAAERDRLGRERDELTGQAVPLRHEAGRAAEKLTEAKLTAAKLAERKTYNERIVSARERDISAIEEDVAEQGRSIVVKDVAIQRADEALSLFALIEESLSRRLRVLDDALDASQSNASSVHEQAASARDEARQAHDAYDETSARMAQVRVDKGRLEMRVEVAVNAIVRDLGVPIDRAQELPELENRQQTEDEAFKLERRIKNMGAISPDAAEEYAEVKQRHDYLAGQLADMESARRSLNRIVRVIDARMKDDFVRTYEQVNSNFNEIFSLLFPGGTAHLALEDPDDIENTGVEVTAQPRGKRLTKMMLMSGGEKSLTALALLFAVYRTRTTPFYILDEVEAALDDTNLRRLASYIDSLRGTTQLIMITHQRRTMEMADVLFGVSMQADGVTKVISQKLERALEQSE